MVDIIHAFQDAVKEIGLLGVLSIIVTAGFLIFGFFNWRLVHTVIMLTGKMTELADRLQYVQNTTIKENTTETKNLTLAIRQGNILSKEANDLLKSQAAFFKKFGSDPMQLCKAEMSIERMKHVIKESGKECPSDATLKTMQEMLQVRERAKSRAEEEVGDIPPQAGLSPA